MTLTVEPQTLGVFFGTPALGYFIGNFLAGRSFHDDLDLEQQVQAWLGEVNEVRISSATEQIPAVRLAEERRQLGKLPAAAYDYGFFDSVLVNQESLVNIDTNRYSVPTHPKGHTLTARIHLERIDLYDGLEQVASHPRQTGQHKKRTNRRQTVPGNACVHGGFSFFFHLPNSG